VGTIGVAARVFTTLANAGVNIIMNKPGVFRGEYLDRGGWESS